MPQVFEFWADPPTTTLQRLKGLTTGSLPTFIDASSNFASSEIDEDNLIDQLVAQNKKIIFMGDDTWESLYPDRFVQSFPYPSFDVWDLDTVDRGVEAHLHKTLSQPQAWDVLVAHYLGVDHAGHKHGPRHQEMSRKLGEMNQALDRVVHELPPKSLLLVFGDHGMTQTGDHGGDSTDELRAGLLVYSPDLHFKSSISTKPVVQVDLVPTLALLMGVPIPYSNLGQLIPEMFPSTKAPDLARLVSLNVAQVSRYLDSYQMSGGRLPEQDLTALRQKKASMEASIDANPNQAVHKGLALLQGAREMCQRVWVEFNVQLMGAGVTLLFLQLCLAYLLVCTPRSRLLTGILSLNFIGILILATIMGGAFGFAALLFGIVSPDHGLLIAVGTGFAASTMAFGYAFLWQLSRSTVSWSQNSNDQTKSHYGQGLMVLLISLCLFCSTFTNSFVVEEGTVLNFLAVSGALLLVFARRSRKESSEGNIWPKGSSTLGWSVPLMALLLVGLLRLSNVYFRCREEQEGYCTANEHYKPMSTLPGDLSYSTYKNYRFASTIVAVAVVVLALPYWQRNVCGNLNGYSPASMMACYAPPAAGALMVCYWALQGHGLGASLVGFKQNELAIVVYILVIALLLAVVMWPEMVYIKQNKKGQIRPGSEVSVPMSSSGKEAVQVCD